MFERTIELFDAEILDRFLVLLISGIVDQHI